MIAILKLMILLFSISAQAECRSSRPVHEFNKQHGYPQGRSGYIVDHVCPLACNGIDAPINMQYQTIEEGKRKDKWERTKEGCQSLCYPFNSTPERRVFNCR